MYHIHACLCVAVMYAVHTHACSMIQLQEQCFCLQELTCVLVESIRGCCVRWCPGGRASRWAPRGQTATGSGGCRSAYLGGCRPAVPVGSRPTVRVDFRPSVRTGLRPGGRDSCLPSGPWSRCSWDQESPAKAGRSLPGQPAGEGDKRMKTGSLKRMVAGKRQEGKIEENEGTLKMCGFYMRAEVRWEIIKRAWMGQKALCEGKEAGRCMEGRGLEKEADEGMIFKDLT